MALLILDWLGILHIISFMGNEYNINMHTRAAGLDQLTCMHAMDKSSLLVETLSLKTIDIALTDFLIPPGAA